MATKRGGGKGLCSVQRAMEASGGEGLCGAQRVAEAGGGGDGVTRRIGQRRVRR